MLESLRTFYRLQKSGQIQTKRRVEGISLYILIFEYMHADRMTQLDKVLQWTGRTVVAVGLLTSGICWLFNRELAQSVFAGFFGVYLLCIIAVGIRVTGEGDKVVGYGSQAINMLKKVTLLLLLPAFLLTALLLLVFVVWK